MKNKILHRHQLTKSQEMTLYHRTLLIQYTMTMI